MSDPVNAQLQLDARTTPVDHGEGAQSVPVPSVALLDCPKCCARTAALARKASARTEGIPTVVGELRPDGLPWL